MLIRVLGKRSLALTRGGRALVTALCSIVLTALVLPLVWPSTTAAAATGCPSGTIVIGTRHSTADVQSKLAAPGRNRTFCWTVGVHRIDAPLKLHSGDSFVGVTERTTGQRATIDGSALVTGWNEISSSRWVAAVPGLAEPKLNLPPGLRCHDETNHCAYPDDVYWGDRRLTRVWSLDEQGLGSYFVDYLADRIYVGRDPAGAPISRAVPLPVVSGRSQPLIRVQPGGAIRNIVIRKAGVGVQGAAVEGYEYVVEHATVYLSHGRGIGTDDLSTITSSQVYSNGQGGIGIGKHLATASGPPGVIHRNSVHHNGWIMCWGICAGIKASNVVGLTIRGNVVNDNFAQGIWIDNDSIAYRVVNNRVLHNRTAGIEMEISYDGVVERNIVSGTSLHPMDEGSVGAIHVLASGPCTVSCPASATGTITIADNTIGMVRQPNAFGIVLRQLDRGSGRYGAHLVRRVRVNNNRVVLLRGWTGAVDPSGDTSIYERANTFAGNAYVVQTKGAQVFRWRSPNGGNDWLTFAQWQTRGNDVAGKLIVQT